MLSGRVFHFIPSEYAIDCSLIELPVMVATYICTEERDEEVHEVVVEQSTTQEQRLT